jgi:hypothetical protein
MKQYPLRETVDLSGYPDLVVVYLGMRVNALRGLATLLGMGPKIASAARARPDGLLAHENIIYSLFPMHIGMRQDWRDFDSLERWTRSEPHRIWWKSFVRDPQSTGLWHETYCRRGGMEAIYSNMPDRLGFRAFAPVCPAQGPMRSSRQRAGRDGEAPPVPVQE